MAEKKYHEFAQLLTDAVYRIRIQEKKTIATIHDELGRAMGRNGGTIEYWRKGKGVPNPTDLEKLASELVKRGGLTPEKLKEFGRRADYPELADRVGPEILIKSVRPIEEFAPSVIGVPIFHPRQFFGRERELKRIFGLLSRLPLQHVTIIGKRSSGKTSLLKYLQTITTTPPEELPDGQRNDWLSQPNTYRWVLVDFLDPRMRTRRGFMQHILKDLNLPVPDPLELEDFLDLIIEQLQTPTVILMDDIGKGFTSELDQHFWLSLRALAGTLTNGNLAFVLTARDYPHLLAERHGEDSPFFNMFGHILKLGPLKEKEARELIDSSPNPFSPADIEWILTHSRRWPCTLQTLCYIRQMALEDRDSSEEWKQEGLAAIEHFKHLWEGDQ